MKRFLMLAAVIAALATIGTSAEAGWRSYGWNSHYGSHGGYGWRRNFGHRNHYSPRVHRTWHDTSHYDYHPGQFVRHGNHFHSQPGHYDLHRTGHWDTHLHH
jgi:hypothetical protein